MKKLLLILAASLAVPMTSSSLYAREKAPNVPKLSELNLKGLDHFANRPKLSGERITTLDMQPSANSDLAAAKAKASEKAQEFKCGLLYSDKWDGADNYGAYTFTTADINSFERKYLNSEALPNAGGFFTENKYYFTYYTKEDYDSYVTTYVVNTDTWTLDKTVDQDGDVYSVAYDLAYDPIEQVAFGSFYDGSDDTSFWGYMDPSSCTVYKIAQLEGILVAVAINDSGDAYGITNGGYLVKIDKYSGALTVVKGITTTTSDYQQSAAFAEDGSLYWALVGKTSTGGYGTGLAKIDVSTGSAQLLGQFDDSENVVALYCEPTAADEGAPADPTNLALNYVDDQLTGTVSFDVANVDNQGATIEGQVTYIIYVDGEVSVTDKVAVGTTASVSVTVPKAGVHTIAVVLQNDKGNSRRVSKSQWIGIDRPVAVTDLTLTKNGYDANLSWTAPTEGALGGYFDPARVSYTITRLSDNKVVAKGLKETTYTDDLSSLQAPTYVTYKVTAYSDDAQGASATSNGLVFGPALSTPASFTFDTEADYNVFTIIDNNENLNKDDGIWEYSPSAQCVGYVPGTLDGDDWLITPSIKLKADRQYIFTYDDLCYSDYWPGLLEVYMGTSATIEGLTTKIVPKKTIYWEDYRTSTVIITVPEDGEYNFGFHALSEAGGSFFLVDNITITDSYNLKAPVAVTELTAVAGDKGALNAKVSFTTPTKAVDGTDLTSLAYVKVYRDLNLVRKINNPEVGAQLSIEDVDLSQGTVVYRVVAATEQGEGVAAEAQVYVGIDTPSEPTVHTSVNSDNHPVIKWDAPQGRGQNGGYVDPTKLTYIVYRATDEAVLASGNTSMSFVDEEVEYDEEDDQQLIQYGVFAVNSAGTGYPGTNFVIRGGKYPLPFKESFAKGTTDKLLLISTSVSGTDGYDNWSIDNDYNGVSQDNDGGNIMVMPATPGSQSTIQMGKIDMSNAKNANLTFHLMRYDFENDYPETNPEDDNIEVFVGGSDYETTLVQTIRSCDLKAGKYTKFTVPLTQYEGSDFIYLQFKMNSVAAYYPILLDNIEVRNTYDVNMQVASVTVPTTVDVTKDFNAVVTVKNDGLQTASAYSVTVTAGDQTFTQESTKELASEETAEFTFALNALATWPETQEIVATVSIEGDENAQDNSDKTSITLLRPEIDAVTDLTVATDESTATFTWTSPEVATTQHIVESFESYAHGNKNTGDLGNWTTIDNDGIWGVNADVYVPNIWGYRAFTVFDPEDGENGDVETYGGHTGDKSIVAFTNFENDNDDWLISPKLTGKAQTISFWAHGVASKEYLYVLYSTTKATVKSFKDLDDNNIKLTSSWKKYEFELPEGALYFAINYEVSSSASEAAVVDDIEFDQEAVFNVKPEIEGFNIYRDGVKLNEQPLTEPTYTVTSDVNGKYYVTTVYNVGESEASNVVTVDLTGVEDITIDASNSNEPTYDIYGRRVYNLQNGQIYLRKGQKFIYRK
jgi:hypothetical protein